MSVYERSIDVHECLDLVPTGTAMMKLSRPDQPGSPAISTMKSVVYDRSLHYLSVRERGHGDSCTLERGVAPYASSSCIMLFLLLIEPKICFRTPRNWLTIASTMHHYYLESRTDLANQSCKDREDKRN
jgi:hypothetical protein